jgi:L-threonylcarbamoyladenylate synthase
MRHFYLDPAHPEPAVLNEAAAIIRAGGVVALPTDTVYGLAADPFNPQAVLKVFAAKNRPQEQPLLLLIDSPVQAAALTEAVQAAARTLMAAFWPGALTLILPGKPGLPERMTNSRGGVALRLPDQRLCRELIRITGPITAPSANRHGQPSGCSAAQVSADLAGRVDAVIDGGATGSRESTIVDCSSDGQTVLVREGVSLRAMVRDALASAGMGELT